MVKRGFELQKGSRLSLVRRLPSQGRYALGFDVAAQAEGIEPGEEARGGRIVTFRERLQPGDSAFDEATVDLEAAELAEETGKAANPGSTSVCGGS